MFLSLVDSKVSEFNVANYTSFINKQISHTIMYLEDQRLPDMKSALGECLLNVTVDPGRCDRVETSLGYDAKG